MGSFGDRLKKEREQRGITLDDISLNTKIGTRLLRALEEERFDQLPGGIFNKGFVRAYARHVGIDEEQAVADYISTVDESQNKAAVELHAVAEPAAHQPEPPPAPEIHVVRETRQAASEREIPWGLLAILLLLIALVFAGWSYYHRERVGRNRGPEPAPMGDTPAPDTRESAPVSAQAASRYSPTGPISGSPATAEGSMLLPGSVSPSAAQAVQRAASIAPATVAAPGAFTVVLKANEESEECWVSVVVDGQPPFEATLEVPYERQIQARNEVVVKAGNVGALDFFFNGKKLPPQGDHGMVKTLTFHSDGLQPSPSQPLVTGR